MGKNDRRRNFTISYFSCTKCEYVLTLPRLKYRKRERLHIKDMWCPMCKADSQFKEFRSETELHSYQFAERSGINVPK
jgi:uncharacterized CHY-type Zn-finger protein